ncbi:MAG: sulfatase [Jaaginema sp. PMC 1079.18]|nr:sulfatase [Jaaginema sp. PMC 1080.18]MEC4849456.1 sulfatase [Jaaginema sp. PMC 1079.18]MEC4865445.1 sulfatase [Jaaginema sp. PMC 1078.18]
MSISPKITRRSFLATSLATSSLLIARHAFAQSQHNSTPQRNILILISDDQGIDQLGCYGNSKVNTPNLDNLAKSGVHFTRAFTPSSSCSASRGSILTGLYPHQNGQYGHAHRQHNFRLHEWVQPLPMLLKASGYQTGLIGKLHVGGDKIQFPFDFMIPEAEIQGNRDVLMMAEKAGEFFNLDSTQPFFLLVGYSDPHRLGATFGNEPNYSGIEPKKYQPDEVVIPYYVPDIPEARGEMTEMYEAIARLDAGIGMVINQLQKSGRYNDTLILYLTDNGIPFPGAKTNLYDSGTNLPLIIAHPKLIQSNKVNRHLINFTDLVPTLLDYTETPIPTHQLPGQSFLPIINIETGQDWSETYFSHIFHGIHMYYPMRGICTGKYKYINNLYSDLKYPIALDILQSKTWQGMLERNLNKVGQRPLESYLHRPSEELYDLENDPQELFNLAANPRFTDVLETLRSKVQKMREMTNDPWLTQAAKLRQLS